MTAAKSARPASSGLSRTPRVSYSQLHLAPSQPVLHRAVSPMDLLNDLHEALTAAGVEPALVTAVLAQVRHTWGRGDPHP